MPRPGEAVLPVTDAAAHRGLSRASALLLGSLQRASRRHYEPSEVGELQTWRRSSVMAKHQGGDEGGWGSPGPGPALQEQALPSHEKATLLPSGWGRPPAAAARV